MYVYICVYIYIYVCIYMCINMYIYVYIYVCICIHLAVAREIIIEHHRGWGFTNVHLKTNNHVCMYIHVCIYMFMRVYICMYMYLFCRCPWNYLRAPSSMEFHLWPHIYVYIYCRWTWDHCQRTHKLLQCVAVYSTHFFALWWGVLDLAVAREIISSHYRV